MQSLDLILEDSSRRHKHLCPRQVLGARMSLFAGELLQLELPRVDKRLLVIAETDGCAIDGIIAATGCHIGSRTLHIYEFGKVAATFVDAHTEEAIRIVPNREARSLAWHYAPDTRNHWEAMLLGYQVMPVEDLFCAQYVMLNNSLAELISKPGKKAQCEICKEEILNGREVIQDGSILCRSCAGESYYEILKIDKPLLKDKIAYQIH